MKRCKGDTNLFLGEVLAVQGVARCAHIVQSIDEAIRVALHECDTELDDLVGGRGTAVHKARWRSATRLAHDHIPRKRLSRCESKERGDEHELGDHRTMTVKVRQGGPWCHTM